MSTKCSVEGCNNPSQKKGMCDKHHWRTYYGSGNSHIAKKYAPAGSGSLTCKGYRRISYKNGKGKLEHVLIVEMAMGKSLPKGVEIHHVDGNKSNNVKSNLVVCPNQAYHKLLHKRQQAFEFCGNPDYRKCWICKEWDAPENLRIRKEDVVHRACANSYFKALHQSKINGG